MPEFNPYAPPQAQVAAAAADAAHEDRGPWRDGKRVVALRDGPFPQRCLKCNAQLRVEQMRRRDFSSHHATVFLLLLLSPLIYVIAALLLRKRSRHAVGLCARHVRWRRIFIVIAWSAPLWTLAGVAIAGEDGVLPGLALSVVSLIVGLFGSQWMHAQRIDAREAVFRGCGKAFVASLPPRG